MILSVTKKAEDAISPCRVSLGAVTASAEMPEPAGTVIGFYCVYRGKKELAIQALETALKAMRDFAVVYGPDGEPPIQADDGKKYS